MTLNSPEQNPRNPPYLQICHQFYYYFRVGVETLILVPSLCVCINRVDHHSNSNFVSIWGGEAVKQKIDMKTSSPSLVVFLVIIMSLNINNSLAAAGESISIDDINNLMALHMFSHLPGKDIGRSSYEPRYKIEFHSTDSPFDPVGDQEAIAMYGKNGQRFLCFLPKEATTKKSMSTSQLNTTDLIGETENQVKLQTPEELLGVLKNKCFYRDESWWSYEFCYQKKLRQFRVEKNKVVLEFVLGIYDKDTTMTFNQNFSDYSILKDPRSKDASQRYYPHKYTNGTVCGLNNQPRETEVRFVCSEPTSEISSITELSTCKYALTLNNPMLCKNPLFQNQRAVEHTINCNELPHDTKSTEVEEDSFKAK